MRSPFTGVVLCPPHETPMTAAPLTVPQSFEVAPAPGTKLRGAPLWLVRSAWLVALAATLVVQLALVPLNVRYIGSDWQVEVAADALGIARYTYQYGSFAWLIFALRYAGLLFFVAVALFIAWRQSDDWIALCVSATLLLLTVAIHYGGYNENYFWYPYPWDKLLPLLDSVSGLLGVGLVLVLFFVFPDGRFVPRALHWLAAAPLVLVLPYLAGLFQPGAQVEALWLASLGVVLTLMVAAAVAQAYRYRRVSNALQRAQTRWVVFGWIGAVAGILVLLPLQAAGPPSLALLLLVLTLLVPLLLPASFAIAMTRHGLWQSDPLLNRALVYGSLSAILLLVYIVLVAALSELLRVTDHFLVAAISTVVVAFLFQPLRERVQRLINRLMYGERDDPFRVLNRLGGQLESTLTPDAALPLIVETIGRALRVPYAALELTVEGQRTTVAQYGLAQAAEVRMPLRYQNETLGDLLVARRAPNENFSPADLQLVETLARQAGAVVYAARLYTALQRSRERIVAEREQERRRLRRDLHDGLGPTLASQALKLDAALDLLEAGDDRRERARALLQDVRTQTQATVADIRRIVYELRPPALDELGLVGALRAHLGQFDAASGLDLALTAPDDLPALSAVVQVNAYRIVVEAVTNVVRHARARTCQVMLTCDDHTLQIEVQDNGVGFAPGLSRGVGLHAMRERAAEVGGTCEIESAEGQGARLIARLPLANV